MATDERLLPFLSANSATRPVCLGVHLDSTFEAGVFSDFCLPTTKALSPSPGLDLIVVARNAAWVRRTRLWCAMGQAVLLVLTLAGIALIILGFLNGTGLPWRTILGVLVALILAWAWSAFWSIRRAWRMISVMNAADVWDPGAGLISANQEEKIAAVNTSTLCIYDERLDDPFPGLGTPRTEDVMPPVNVTQVADETKPAIPFGAGELHAHVAQKLSRGRGDGITARNVLYVADSWASHFPDIYASGTRIPELNAPPGLVLDAADRPSEGARTYLHAQIVRHGGLLVTTLNTRFKIEHGILSWDLNTHFLGPITGGFLRDGGVPYTRVAALRWSLGRARRGLVQDLFAAPLTVRRMRKMEMQAVALLHPATEQASRKARKAGPLRTPGATTGLREYVDGGGNLSYNQRMDTQDQFQRLLQAVYEEVAAFLEARNVYVEEFRKAQATVVQNIVKHIGDNYTIHGNGKNIAAGPGAMAGDQHHAAGSGDRSPRGSQGEPPERARH